MMSLSAIGRLLSILAIIGLAIAPIVRPVMALPNGDTALADDTAMSMPQDMPCCPKKAPIPDCGRDCLANCATQLLCNAVQGAGLLMPLGPANALPRGNAKALVGLAQRPPLRPPKI